MEEKIKEHEERYGKTRFFVYVIPAMLCSAFVIGFLFRWGEKPVWLIALFYIFLCIPSFVLILFGLELGKSADKGLIKSTIEAEEQFAPQNVEDQNEWSSKLFWTTEIRGIKKSILIRRNILFLIAFFLLLLIFMWRSSTDDDIDESAPQEDSRIAYCSLCDNDITDGETYLCYFTDGRGTYICQSCIEEYDSSASAYSDTSDYSNIEAPSDGFQDDGYIHVYLVGEGETVSVKNSSWITAITYYPDCGHLIITSGSKRYAFANVSESTWNSFKAAPSKGSFYNSTFKGDPQYWVDDYDGANGSLILIEEWNPEY